MKTLFLLFLLPVSLFLNAQIQIEENSFKCPKEPISSHHYDINLDVTDFANHIIGGNTIIEMQASPNTLEIVNLNLIDLSVDSVFQEDIKIDNFVQTDSTVVFTLAQPSDENGDFEVNIYYHGVPFHEGWGGFHWSGEYCFNLGVGFQSLPHNLGRAWFPGIDNFTDRATYDFHIIAENPKKAVCGGTLIDVQNLGENKKEYHWVIEHPIPTYLASVAVGDYAEINDVYNGIEGDIPIQIFVRPQDSVDVEGTFVNLKSILNIYETHFGAYPWERVGYVGTSIGAMEHVMNIAYPHSAINGNTNYDWWYAHELFHMWFGDNVTCSSAEDMWLNEGWASYSEGFFQEFLYNDRQIMVDYLRNKHFEALHLAHTPNGDGSYFPLNEIPQNVTYGVCAYKKGSSVVQSLRGYLGDDTFFSAMTDYQSFFKYQSASSHDMEERMTEHTGIDMSHFFENWVYQAGTPHFSIDSFAINQNGSDYLVDVYVKQKRKGPNFLGNDNMMYIDFIDSEWETITDTLHFSGLTGHKQFTIPYFPEMVVSDYGDRIFDARINYNLTIKNTGLVNFDGSYFKLETDNIEDSTLFRIEHHWVAPDSLKDPVATLKISDYHYWTVDGIFSNNFAATGVFKYSKSNYMDNTLILSDQDSIVLLYRPNATMDWEMVYTERIGFWNSGFLYLDNIQKGDYAFGVVDVNYVGIENQNTKGKNIIQLFPNPTSDTFALQSEYDGIAKLYSSKGEFLSKKRIIKNQKITWDISSLENGIYFIHFISKNKKFRRVERINKI